MKNALKLAACALCLSSCATPMAPDGPSATTVMRPASGSQAHGSVKFTQVGSRVRVDAEIAGALARSARHPHPRKRRLHRA